MGMKSLIDSIIKKHAKSGIDINSPATIGVINAFEEQIGFSLPQDFKEFYSNCNGFGCNEDIFNMVSLGNIMHYPSDYGPNWFYFSEYMIYSDMWGLRLTSESKYELFNGSYPKVPLTSSLETFLNRFLIGNVFETGGLYDWHEELKIKSTL